MALGLWKRIGNLFSKPEAPKAPASMLTLSPGDICEVSLVTYEVTGRTKTSGRNAVVLTLRDGSRIAYLYIEEREELQYRLYHPIDGRLDSPPRFRLPLSWMTGPFIWRKNMKDMPPLPGRHLI